MCGSKICAKITLVLFVVNFSCVLAFLFYNKDLITKMLCYFKSVVEFWQESE